MTVLLGPPSEHQWNDSERRALTVLAESGLLPPLRWVTPLPSRQVG